ncbi:hypothetical protein AX769_06190 [Frondihabitans sp. PAMC 28766]|uniref:hypothetical protein n=1 Tax=Frondihabitans sp. PAMC 28766 TaxID=1795630 RepID=UPI00078D0BFE|nr:hypothetical protein [Frondihabitans sp. PAMC 28766]AMM19818.1 hypothetical protein AX769_06190 [Frondihabitans sp. PAMC 28766]
MTTAPAESRHEAATSKRRRVAKASTQSTAITAAKRTPVADRQTSHSATPAGIEIARKTTTK